MTAYYRDGRWAGSYTKHIIVADTKAEAVEAVEWVKHCPEMVALRNVISERYGDNHGGYRHGNRRR